MDEDSSHISTKTWSRSIEPLDKAGYMDGAADGQSSAYQSSFDVGYCQGFTFGLKLGLNEALKSSQNCENNGTETFNDTRKINCQICIHETTAQEKVDNLYNKQEENNRKYFKTIQRGSTEV